MAGPGNVVGIRNRLPSDRERRMPEPVYDYSNQGLEHMHQALGQYGIGRYLISKRDAKKQPEDLENPVVNIIQGLVNMNRHRGTAIDMGKVVLQYQSPEQFSERVLASAQHGRNKGHLTPRGEKLYLAEMKRRVSGTLGRQSSDEAARLEEQMRLEEQQLKFAEMDEREKLGWLQGVDHQEWLEEYGDVIVELPAEGAFATTGANRTGFKFSSKFHFDGLQVGLKVKHRDTESGAEVQNDVDRINEAYRTNGLIFGDYRELRVDDIPLFVPLFNVVSEDMMDEMYLPYITRQGVHFQGLGIHKIQ